ncbi:MAG: hypothetical protein JO112_20875, partial [Planctomycetes bacterium]|nr:hypothetical protein [Planctomycetota bacterium]
MEQFKQIISPVVDLLPEQARPYAPILVAVAAVLILILLLLLLRALGRALFGGGEERPEDSDREFLENLAAYPPAPLKQAERRLTVYNVPVRLRLVVVAPAGKEGKVNDTEVERLLDQVVPGLAALAAHDRPRIRVWPGQLSHHGFAATFFRRTRTAEREGQPSRWVLLAGRVQL